MTTSPPLMSPRKPKHEDAVFTPYLRPDEHLLWAGKPSSTHLLRGHDIFILPIACIWLVGVGGAILETQEQITSLILHLLFGVYVVFGRFILEYLRRRRTWYAVTDRRVLILQRLLPSRLSTYYFNTLPFISLHGTGRYGTIRFEVMPPSGKRGDRNLNRIEMFSGSTAFYDIDGATTVFSLIDELHGDPDDEVLFEPPATHKRKSPQI